MQGPLLWTRCRGFDLVVANRGGREWTVENAQRITALSRKLRRVSNGLIVFLPAACALFWIFFNRIYPVIGSMIAMPVHVVHDLPPLTRFLSFLADLIPLGATIYGLRTLRELFVLYEKGLIFTEQNVKCFRSLGRTLLVWMVLHIFNTTLSGIILTLNNPPGKRLLVIAFDSGAFAAAFVGVIVVVTSRVMDEGRKIQEDQSLII